MGTYGSSLRRLILIILFEELLLLPVQSQMSPTNTAQSKSHDDTITEAIANTTNNPLLTSKQIDSTGERFDLTTKHTTEPPTLTPPPQVKEQVTDFDLEDVTSKDSEAAQITPPPKQLAETATDWEAETFTDLVMDDFDDTEADSFDLEDVTSQDSEAAPITPPPKQLAETATDWETETFTDQVMDDIDDTEADSFDLEDVTSKDSEAAPITPPTKQLAETATDSEPEIFTDQVHEVEIPNVFNGIGNASWTLVEKIIEVEEAVCYRSCRKLESFSYLPAVPSSCNSCQCDPTCVVYHTCCPDLLLRKLVSYDGLGSDCVELIPTGVNTSDISNLNFQTDGLLSSMITKCHAVNNGFMSTNNRNAQNQTQEDISRSKCEQPDFSKPDELFPVSDQTTKITYRNVHCAKCNYAEEERGLKTWESEIICDGNLDLLLESKPNKTELYRLLTSKEEVERSGCHIAYSPTQYGFERKCRYRLRPVIESCNETGLWPQRYYSADIERACHMQSYSSIFANKFKNMFCYLCNTDEVYNLEALVQFAFDSPQANLARLSFSALIDFSDTGNDGNVGESETLICHDAQVYDNLTCTCRDTKCSEGKELITDENECRSFARSNVLGYRACARFDIEVYGPTKLDDFDRLFRMSYLFQPSYQWTMTLSRWCPGSRDFTIHVKILEIHSNSFGPVEDMETRLKDTAVYFCEILSHETVFGQLKACAFKYIEECPDNEGYSLPCDIDDTLIVTQRSFFGWLVADQSDISKKTTFLPYLETNRCAFVEISVAEFNASDAMLTHLVSGQRIPVSKVDYIQNNTLIRLCLDDFLQWTQVNASRCENEQGHNDSFDNWTTAGLISIISSCISLFFLFLTLVTYVFFGQLRSGGGKNITVLTVTLFIAQALYEFTIEQYENEYLCSIFGISIHFFWLASVFSTNACTLERFYKLSFPLKSRSFFMSGKSFLIATAYTFLCPLVIVICNISANMSIKHHVGYGNSRLCYINERNSRIFSFVAPLCVIVVVNMALLIFTICKLRRKTVPGDRKSSQTRIGLVACVRLSVVTGATWLVSLLYEAVPVQAMGYIFTALLGLQGVVFFFSLAVNPKTIELYRKHFSTTSKPHSSGGYGSRTTGLSKKSDETRGNGFNDVGVQENNSASLGTGHANISRVSSGDSGFGYPDAEVKKEENVSEVMRE